MIDSECWPLTHEGHTLIAESLAIEVGYIMLFNRIDPRTLSPVYPVSEKDVLG